MIRVITLNLRYGTAEDGPNHWQNRREILLECLRRYPFDLLGTQEGLRFQLEAIREGITHLDYIGLGRYEGVETDREHERFGGEHCAVFYDTRRWSVGRQGTFWLSDTPEVPGSMTWGNTLPRIVTWAIFRLSGNGREVAVFNTHFHWGEPFVQRASELIVEKMRELAGGLPMVLTGDFNLEPESPPWRFFVDPKEGSLVDCWLACGQTEEGSGTFHDFSGEPKQRIDWILVSQDVRPVKIERIEFHQEGRYPSDHFPVRAKLEL